MEKVEIHLDSYPKHKVKVFIDNNLKGQIEIDDGMIFLDSILEFEDCDIMEEAIMKRMCKKANELFKATKIEVSKNER